MRQHEILKRLMETRCEIPSDEEKEASNKLLCEMTISAAKEYIAVVSKNQQK